MSNAMAERERRAAAQGRASDRSRRGGEARPLLYWSLCLLVSVGLGLAVGEAAVRGVLDHQYHVWPPGMQVLFTPSPEVMPGVSGPSHFVINRDGVRGDPIPAETSYNILAIGGSTTECLYLDETKAWPYLLQQDLAADANVWVGNVGKSGLNSKHHMLQVEHLTQQYPGLRALILLVGANDFLQRLAKGDDYRPFPGLNQIPLHDFEQLMSEAFFTWPGSDPREPAPKRLAIWRIGREFKYRYLASMGKQLLQNEDGSIFTVWRSHRRNASAVRTALPDLTSGLEEYARNLRTLVGTATARGVRIIMATQPSLWRADLPPRESGLLWLGGVGKYQEEPGHEYYSAAALADGMRSYNERLLRLCAEERWECVDLEREIPKDGRMFYDDAHFTEAGSKQVARVFARYFRSTAPFHKKV